MGFPLPLPGDDAFKRGFLSKRFATDVVEQINKKKLILMPPGWGQAICIQNALNDIYDFTGISPQSADFPGKVSNASTAVTAMVQVSLRTSIIGTTFAQTDNVPITGLGVAKPVSANQSVYLRYDVSAKTAEVLVGNWPQYPSPVGWVNPVAASLVQQYAYVSLARVYTNNPDATVTPDLVLSINNTNLAVYQLVRTGLAVYPICYQGANVVLLQPWADGYN